MFLLLVLVGCGPDLAAPAAWATNEASLVPSATGISGAQVWRFYGEGWARKQDPDELQCTLTQELQGAVMAPLDGCLRCSAMYEVSLRELDTDCAESVLEGVVLDGLVAVGVGEPHPDLEADNPRPDIALGWYLSFDGELAEAHGWLWPEDGQPVGGSGWRVDVPYSFEPGYAWQLGPAE